MAVSLSLEARISGLTPVEIAAAELFAVIHSRFRGYKQMQIRVDKGVVLMRPYDPEKGQEKLRSGTVVLPIPNKRLSPTSHRNELPARNKVGRGG